MFGGGAYTIDPSAVDRSMARGLYYRPLRRLQVYGGGVYIIDPYAVERPTAEGLIL